MKRIQALILLIILLVAPFLKAPAYFFCAMRSGKAQAACCCQSGPTEPNNCCKIVPLPLGDRLAGQSTQVSAPDLAGLLVPTLAPMPPVPEPDRLFLQLWRDQPRSPDRPLFLLLSAFLS